MKQILHKGRASWQAGFTLVELLIVIALIAILSVAVLSTINPIEQSNKARDSRVQNDAAEILNAMERYYASVQKYPWEYFTTNPITSADSVLLRSDTYGFGICSGAVDADTLQDVDPSVQAAECSASDDVPNLLISTMELKSSFAGKDSFEPVRSDVHPEYGLWVAKTASGDSLYVCYIPRANANRRNPDVNIVVTKCINETDGTVIDEGSGTCVATDGSTDWGKPVTNGTVAMFRCVPE